MPGFRPTPRSLCRLRCLASASSDDSQGAVHSGGIPSAAAATRIRLRNTPGRVGHGGGNGAALHPLGEDNQAGLLRLRVLGLEPDVPGSEVDLLPAQLQNLCLPHPPAGSSSACNPARSLRAPTRRPSVAPGKGQDSPPHDDSASTSCLGARARSHALRPRGCRGHGGADRPLGCRDRARRGSAALTHLGVPRALPLPSAVAQQIARCLGTSALAPWLVPLVGFPEMNCGKPISGVGPVVSCELERGHTGECVWTDPETGAKRRRTGRRAPRCGTPNAQGGKCTLGPGHPGMHQYF